MSSRACRGRRLSALLCHPELVEGGATKIVRDVVTVGRALRTATDRLGESSLSPRADAQLLLADVLDCDRAALIAHAERQLDDSEQRALDAFVLRRGAGVPIAYLVGSAWFYKREFIVDERVLIPRPETEHLVDEALHYVRSCEKAVVLDVGTGSGAIACTLAAEASNATVYATDYSAEALAVAERNAFALGLHRERRIVFQRADLLPEVDARFDAVVANLPYIPTSDLPAPPISASFEPREALDGGGDGLREYRRLLRALPSRLNAEAIVLMEAAPPTVWALRDLTQAAFSRCDVTVERDYSGEARYVRLLFARSR